MAKAKAKTTNPTVYLLLLDGPVNSVPVGVYGSAKAAVEAAQKFGIPEDGSRPSGKDLSNAVDAGPYVYKTFGVVANEKPCGYMIMKFVNGEPEGWRYIEPFTDREYALPDDPGADVPFAGIDATQIEEDRWVGF